MRKIVLAGLATLALVTAGAVTALPAQAATTVVVALDGKATVSNCNATTATPYKTISSAVSAVAPGSTIVVCPGTYHETVVAGDGYIFKGAKAGVDARTRATTGETIVDGGGGPAFATSGQTTIDGFTISGATATSTTAGIEFNGPDEIAENDIFTGNNVALLDETDNGLVLDNKFVAPAGGQIGVWLPVAISGAGITDNAFSGHFAQGAINVAIHGTQVAGPTIARNTDNTTAGGSFAVIAGTSGLTMTDNTVTGGVNSSDGILLIGSDDNYNLQRNTIHGLQHAAAIRLGENIQFAPNGSGTISKNHLYSNGAGIDVSFAATTATINANLNVLIGNSSTSSPEAIGSVVDEDGTTVNAVNNFFGCNAGPGQPGCGAVSAPSVGLTVSPWLVLTTSVASGSIANGGTTTATADLNHDSAGITLIGVSVPDGAESATFSFDHGTVTPATAPIAGGLAQTTVKGTSVGSGTVTATVEAATSTGPLPVIGAAPTTLAIADAAVAEGNSGTHTLVFTVSLSQTSSTKAVTVHFATVNGTATAGSDYVAKSGTLTIAKGKSSGTISIVIKGDKLQEANETFTVKLTKPTNATLGRATATGTILNDD